MRPLPILSIALMAGLWMTPSAAGAALIDFRNETYTCPGPCADPDGESSAQLVVDGVTWTFTPQPQPDATLYWDSTDGFGVRYDYETDEIEGRESLLISFSAPVYIGDVYLTDLFDENGYQEQGWYELDSSGVQPFLADAGRFPSPASNGEKVLSINSTVSSITFSAPGRINGQNHEFSVAGLDTTRPIPEPDALLLFPVGAAIVGFAIRRQRKLTAQT